MKLPNLSSRRMLGTAYLVVCVLATVFIVTMVRNIRPAGPSFIAVDPPDSRMPPPGFTSTGPNPPKGPFPPTRFSVDYVEFAKVAESASGWKRLFVGGSGALGLIVLGLCALSLAKRERQKCPLCRAVRVGKFCGQCGYRVPTSPLPRKSASTGWESKAITFSVISMSIVVIGLIGLGVFSVRSRRTDTEAGNLNKPDVIRLTPKPPRISLGSVDGERKPPPIPFSSTTTSIETLPAVPPGFVLEEPSPRVLTDEEMRTFTSSQLPEVKATHDVIDLAPHGYAPVQLVTIHNGSRQTIVGIAFVLYTKDGKPYWQNYFHDCRILAGSWAEEAVRLDNWPSGAEGCRLEISTIRVDKP